MPTNRDKLTPAQRQALTARIQAAKRANTVLPEIDRNENIALSFAQERVWLHWRLHPNSLVYNRPAYFRYRGKFELVEFEKCITDICQRHETLRTTLTEIDGQAFAQITDSVSLQVDYADLSNDPAAVSAAKAITVEEANRPFDLGRELPIRAKVLKLGEQDHLLLLTFHHIAFDAWSESQLLGELQQFKRPSEPQSETLKTQYYDFAMWQRQLQNLPQATSSRQAWRSRLTDLPNTLLPTDFPRSPEPSESAGSVPVYIPAELLAALKQMAGQSNSTLFALFLTTLQILIYRYTGDPRCIIGCPTAGRSLAEAEAMIGLFTNPLPFCTDLDPTQDFATALARTQDTVMHALNHQQVPLQVIAQDSGVNRDASGSPLYQVMFVYENWHTFPNMPDDSLQRVTVPSQHTMVDLSLELDEIDGAVSGRLIYRASLWQHNSIERMVDHYLNLLHRAVTTKNTLAHLPMLSPAELADLNLWNQTASSTDTSTRIEHAFANRVSQQPNSVALIHDQQEITFQTLDDLANTLANDLIDAGVTTNDLVAVVQPRSPNLIASLLAVLKCGAAFVPLDPELPTLRLKTILKDAQPRVILTVNKLEDSLDETLAASGITVLTVDQAGLRRTPPPVQQDSEQAAYVIYTSGSTGKPKGVVGSHAAALNRFHWMWQTLTFAADEVACQKTSISFVDSIWEIFGPLLKGVPLVIIDEQTLTAPQQLAEALSDHGVTRLVLVPTLLELLLTEVPDLPRLFSKLKLCITSGEAISVQLAEQFREALPDVRLLNLYGSSEVTADVTWFDISAQFKDDELDTIPVGRPIANSQIFVLDGNQEQVPVGVPGEIYIAGRCLANGYLNQPELTEARFITLHSEQQRAFKSGDLGRWRADGQLEWLGRLDHQVKLNGIRIELGDIESAISQITGVNRCAVILTEENTPQARLVAYFQADEPIAAKNMRSALTPLLPQYMVPSIFVQLPDLPLTTSGKIDRTALPTPKVQTGTSDTGPVSAEAEIMLEIWRDVLAQPAISPKDNFFDSGGHSVTAIRMVDRVNRKSNLRLSVADVFRYPTIDQLVEVSAHRDADTQRYRYLECLQRANNNRSLVIVGADLWQELDLDLIDASVYWLKLDGIHFPTRRFEVVDQANKHVLELCQACQDQQFLITGFSYGGVVGFEVASQLAQRGLSAACLLLEPGSGWSDMYLVRQQALKASPLRALILELMVWVRLLIRRTKLRASWCTALISDAFAREHAIDGWSRGLYFLVAQRIARYRPSLAQPSELHIIARDIWLDEHGAAWRQAGGMLRHIAADVEDHTDLIQPASRGLWLKHARELLVDGAQKT